MSVETFRGHRSAMEAEREYRFTRYQTGPKYHLMTPEQRVKAQSSWFANRSHDRESAETKANMALPPAGWKP